MKLSFSDFSECHLSFLSSKFCKHIPQNCTFNINLKSKLHKELAKIKLSIIIKASKAHLHHKPEAANEPE
jgi:hypothetical protein